MFYTHRVLFIHVPRTGGTWLTEYAHQMFGASIDIHWLKHASLERIRQSIPETYNLIPFTILRDMREVEDSTWRLLTDPGIGLDYWEDFKRVAQGLGKEAFLASSFNILRFPFWQGDIIGFPYEKPHGSVLAWLQSIHQ